MAATFDQLIQLLKDCFNRENEMGKMKAAMQAALNAAKTLDDVKKNLDLLARILSMEGDQVKALDQAVSLAGQLQQSQPPPAPTAVPLKAGSVAEQFRGLMDSIQASARQPSDSEVGTTLKSLDIELKGLIVVQDNEAQIVPPAPGSTVDPGTLSTVRLSFGTIPVLRPAQAAPSTAVTPPTPPSTDNPPPTRPPIPQPPVDRPLPIPPTPPSTGPGRPETPPGPRRPRARRPQ